MRFTKTALAAAILILGGCDHDEDSDDPPAPLVLTVTIDTPPGNVTIVAGGMVNFTATVLNGTAPYTYLWTFGAGGPANQTVEDPGNVTFPASGSYIVTVQVTDNDGDMDTDTVTVTVQDIVATITSPPSDVIIDEGDSVDFQATVTGGTPAFTHAWDFDGGAANVAVEDPGPTTFNTAGVYLVMYTVTDSLAANDSDTVTVTVNVPTGAPYTKTEVKNKWATLAPLHGAFSYSSAPVMAVDGSAFEGAIAQQMIDDGVNLVNFYRWLAGLPDTVVENVAQRVNCQKGSHVLVALALFGIDPLPPPPGPYDPHNPPLPTGWVAPYDSNIHGPGNTACGESNVFRGFGGSAMKPDETVHGYMDDFGNASTLGHRRWILHPRLNSTTFGALWSSNRWASLMHITDTSALAPTFDFVAYPSEGFYPKQLFLDPNDGERVLWSFSANSNLYDLAGATVTVTRQSDGQNIPVTTNLLAANFGITPTISFDPDESTQDERYNVTVNNITVLAGGTTSYAYWVEFFDITAP